MMRMTCLLFNICGILSLCLTSVSNAATSARHTSAAYPHMAPMSQYLIADRASEIALARSAAPETISGKATIQVLGPSGYVTVVKGSNGFVCIVERSWLSPFDSSQFWNPKLRGPDCYNPEAAKSILPIVYKTTALALRGLSKNEIHDALKAALAAQQFPRLEAGAMSYMMSKQQLIGKPLNHWLPHLMLYTARDVDWGARAGSPVILSPQFHSGVVPIKVFLIPVEKWSDGTTAPAR
jgi:hypothetical protein